MKNHEIHSWRKFVIPFEFLHLDDSWNQVRRQGWNISIRWGL